MSEKQVKALVTAMDKDGQSTFWQQLVMDQGPRGRELGRRMWNTMPKKYRPPFWEIVPIEVLKGVKHPMIYLD